MSEKTRAILVLFLSPAAAGLNQIIGYGFGARGRSEAVMLTVTAVCAVVVGFALVRSMRAMKPSTPHSETEKFLAVMGAALAAFCLLVIGGMALVPLALSRTD